MSINNNNCLICLEEGKLIEYNHCGNYYVHKKCLNKWKSNDCFICRKKLTESSDEENSESSQVTEQTNDIQIIHNYSTVRTKANICIFSGTTFIISYMCYIFLKLFHIKKHHGDYELEIYFE